PRYPAERRGDDRHLCAGGFRQVACPDRQGLRRQAVTYQDRGPPARIAGGTPAVHMWAMSLDERSDERRNLVGLSRAELAAEMDDFGAEPFRARQLWHWIYQRGVTDFAAMTSLAKGFREQLAAIYELR